MQDPLNNFILNLSTQILLFLIFNILLTYNHILLKLLIKAFLLNSLDYFFTSKILHKVLNFIRSFTHLLRKYLFKYIFNYLISQFMLLFLIIIVNLILYYCFSNRSIHFFQCYFSNSLLFNFLLQHLSY